MREAGSLGDLDTAAAAVVGWVRSAADRRGMSVSVLLVDGGGALRVAKTAGGFPASGRLRSTRRRRALSSGRPVFVPLHERPGQTLAVFPLRSRGRAVGVVEAVARTGVFQSRREVLEAVLDEAASVLLRSKERSELQETVRALGASLNLAADVFRAKAPAAAIRAAVDLCYAQLHLPVAGWVVEVGGGAQLVAMRGLGSRRRAAVRTGVGRIQAPDLSSARARDRLRARFSQIAGSRAVRVEARGAFLFVAGAAPRQRDFLESLGALLADALAHMGVVSLAQARNERLDLGIAWTAHELRSPLVGVRAAIDSLVRSSLWRGSDAEMLKRTSDELGHLLELVIPLLRWSSGAGSLKRRPTDLVVVVRDAIASCELNGDDERVALVAPARVVVRVDARQLRGAVANVVRNALTYSPPGSPVVIRVESNRGRAQIRVRDRGPGIPVEERDRIFDPFTSSRLQGGTGLGLFIARRIVEAHEGKIELESITSGASFRIELPLAAERRAVSAS